MKFEISIGSPGARVNVARGGRGETTARFRHPSGIPRRGFVVIFGSRWIRSAENTLLLIQESTKTASRCSQLRARINVSSRSGFVFTAGKRNTKDKQGNASARVDGACKRAVRILPRDAPRFDSARPIHPVSLSFNWREYSSESVNRIFCDSSNEWSF